MGDRLSLFTFPQPPNGIGPKCSASGPRAATGRNNKDPIIRMVEARRNPKVAVSSLKVPRLNGTGFFAPRLAAIAMGAIIGRNRLMMITRAVAMSHCTAVGEGFELLLSP